MGYSPRGEGNGQGGEVFGFLPVPRAFLAVVLACFAGIGGFLALAAGAGQAAQEAGQSDASGKRGQAGSAGTALKTRSIQFLESPSDSPMKMPSDAALGVDGSVYVLDGVNHRVVVFDEAGKYSFAFGSRGKGPGEFQRPLGIDTGSDGTVYIADSGNSRIQILTPKGEPLGAYALPVSPGDVAPDPTDLALDESRKRLYVADNDNHRIVLFDLTDRSFGAVWGGPGHGPRQFRFPFLLDTTSDGYLLVVEVINTRVQVLSPQGKFVSFLGGWGVRPGQLFRPKGVAAIEGRVLVTDGYLGKIQILGMYGRYHEILADPWGKPLKLTTPTGIVADVQRKRLYVVELKANRVCRLDLE